MKIDPLQLKSISKPGSYSDGDGLFLKVGRSGSKSWIYRYQLAGHRRDVGLGRYPDVSLSDARKERNKLKRDVKSGIDPLHKKEVEKTKQKMERKGAESKKQTFKKCAETYMDLKEPEWRNAKHAQQWRNTLKTYAYPVIGGLPVAEVELDDVLKVLQPIWLEKTETATRVRNRIELVLDYASVMKYRNGENPARWRGNLESIMSKPSKIHIVKHHPALPYDDIAGFMELLQQRKGLAAQALMLTILTATRTQGILGAKWDEFEFQKKVWTIPASRMKVPKEHRIPLSEQTLALLDDISQSRDSGFVFPGKKNKPLSNMAMANVLKRMNRNDITVHGFRSTFRDWVAEKTNFPQRVAETAMAHQIKDGAEAAYQRGDLLEKRKELMEAWADYCLPQKFNVIRIRA